MSDRTDEHSTTGNGREEGRGGEPTDAGTAPDGAGTAVVSRPTGLAERLFRFQSYFGLVAVFVAAVLFSPRADDGEILFLGSENLFNIVRAVSEIGIIGIGLTFVILIGGIDLSVGSMLGLAAVGSSVLLVENDFGVVPAVLVFVGIDGLPIESGGIRAVEAGKLQATSRNPTGGEEAVAAAKKLLIDCRPVEKKQTLLTELITKENAAEVYARLNER